MCGGLWLFTDAEVWRVVVVEGCWGGGLWLLMGAGLWRVVVVEASPGGPFHVAGRGGGGGGGFSWGRKPRVPDLPRPRVCGSQRCPGYSSVPARPPAGGRPMCEPQCRSRPDRAQAAGRRGRGAAGHTVRPGCPPPRVDRPSLTEEDVQRLIADAVSRPQQVLHPQPREPARAPAADAIGVAGHPLPRAPPPPRHARCPRCHQNLADALVEVVSGPNLRSS